MSPVPDASVVAPVEGSLEAICNAKEILENDSMTKKPDASTATAITQPPMPASSDETKPNSDVSFSMNRADYQLEHAIGFGSSAIVYSAWYLPLNLRVAVKLIELEPFERNQIDELRREIQVMSLCRHANVLSVYTAFVHESRLWIVTPYMKGGSCLEIMRSGFKEGFEEPVIASILVQALQGLEYLHRHGHLHRDVKAGNLLMDGDGTVKLADFGVCGSTLLEFDGTTGVGRRSGCGWERKGVRKTFVGTPCWMAPEVMEMNNAVGYDSAADIWSFGITALELAYGHAPYSKFPPMKVIYMTLSGKPPSLDRKATRHRYSKVFKEMIDLCLQRDPTKRPTAAALLKHSFFAKGSLVKKPAYLMETVLARIPPLERRCGLAPNLATIDEANEQEFPEEWNFENDDSATENITRGIPGDDEEDEEEKHATYDEKDFSNSSSNCQDPGSNNTRRGRFIVEGPMTLNDLQNNSSDGTVGTATLPEVVRKGRFSVMETADEDGVDPTAVALEEHPENAECCDISECATLTRKSRFEITTSNDSDTPKKVSSGEGFKAGKSFRRPFALSRFRVSYGGTPSIPLTPRRESNACKGAGKSTRPRSSSGPNNSQYFGYEPGRDPAGLLERLDQFLAINEMMREQLLEMRRSLHSSGCVRSISPVCATSHTHICCLSPTSDCGTNHNCHKCRDEMYSQHFCHHQCQSSLNHRPSITSPYLNGGSVDRVCRKLSQLSLKKQRH